MTDISIGRRIACVASAGAIVTSALIAVGAVVSVIYLLYLGLPYAKEAALWLWSLIPQSGGLGVMLLRIAAGLLVAAGAALVLAFAGFDLLVLAGVAALPLVVMYVLTGDLLVAASTFAVCLILGFAMLIILQFTDEGTLKMFWNTKWEKRELTTRRERYVYASTRHIKNVADDWTPLTWGVAMAMGNGLLTYGFLFLPRDNGADTFQLAALNALTSILVIAGVIAMWVVSFQIWKLLDERLKYGDDSYFWAAGLTSLGPVAGASLGAFLYHSYEGATWGFVIGCFAYTVLGGIFSCEENLFEILKRQVNRT